MRVRRFAMALLCAALAFEVLPARPVAAEALVADDRVELALSAAADAAEVLRTQDEYLDAVSPADRSIWLSRPEPGTTAELGEWFAANAREWTEAERAQLNAMLERVSARTHTLARWLPPRVSIAAINNTDGADFTRGATIFLAGFQDTEAEIDERFFHELFHVLSRHNPERRDALYEAVGFRRCDPMILPDELTTRMLTNPDAPRVEHAMSIPLGDGRFHTTPILLADPPRYDASRGGFFSHTLIYFLTIRRTQTGQCLPVVDTDFSQDDLRAAVIAGAGGNTDYFLHPEELAADNFAQLMMGRTDAPSPQVHARIAQILELER